MKTAVIYEMDGFKVGDIVARKSYGYDVFFKIVDIKDGANGKILTLRGISYRIEADAPENDLVLQSEQKVREYRNKCCSLAEDKSYERYSSRYRGYQKKANSRDTSKDESGKFIRPGKILHLDGDDEYLESCIKEYNRLGLTAIGHFIPEKEQAGKVVALLRETRPDILVLTGHDSFIKGSDSYTNINNYRYSQHYINAVKEARKFSSDMDDLVIFAGACQSLYCELLKAGANFASAPSRDLIHALDPVKVCQKIAFAGIGTVLSPEEVIGNTITGKTGIGGVQTRGKLREGFPLEPFSQKI